MKYCFFILSMYIVLFALAISAFATEYQFAGIIVDKDGIPGTPTPDIGDTVVVNVYYDPIANILSYIDAIDVTKGNDLFAHIDNNMFKTDTMWGAYFNTPADWLWANEFGDNCSLKDNLFKRTDARGWEYYVKSEMKPIPEPSTFILLCLALLGYALNFKRIL